MEGLRHTSGGTAVPPYSRGPYIWDQHVTMNAGVSGANVPGKCWYVDGTNGKAANDAKSWTRAISTIQGAIDLAGADDVIYVAPKLITDLTGDPTSYAENLIIPVAAMGLSIIGVSRGRSQGGLPQVKKGSGSSALLTIQAAGCLIANMGFNGASSTGGGILLDDDYSTKTAFGTTIAGCHFKNCRGSSATSAVTGGAIMWSGEGNAWQVLISGNRFYKNVADVVLKGTSNTQPQDVVIENNVFSGPAANTDCNLFLSGAGDGINGVIIRNNDFTAVPTLGTNDKMLSLTGCTGVLVGNRFACTGRTFGAAGDEFVPTTVLMADNYQEVAVGDNNYQSGHINRT